VGSAHGACPKRLFRRAGAFSGASGRARDRGRTGGDCAGHESTLPVPAIRRAGFPQEGRRKQGRRSYGDRRCQAVRLRGAIVLAGFRLAAKGRPNRRPSISVINWLPARCPSVVDDTAELLLASEGAPPQACGLAPLFGRGGRYASSIDTISARSSEMRLANS
jgi:hypothetical protein